MGSFWSGEKKEENLDPSQQLNAPRWIYEDSVLEIQQYRNPGVSILKDILSHIKLDDRLKKENNEILQEFLRTFREKLQDVDELFLLLFSELRYCGSFYSKLRVSTPDEFDINVVLKLPFKESDFEITHQPQAPSYVQYRLKDHQTVLKKYPQLAKSLFNDGNLIPDNVRRWLQSVVDKALPTYKPPIFCNVRTRQAGPARTILLTKSDGTQIDIDLVPVVSCTLFLPRSSFDGRVERKVGNNLKTFLVPKPYSSYGRQMPISEKVAQCLWRSHFPDPEKEIIHNLGCVKPIIKLLKLLRDKENWKVLASYYLKTVVMWMVIKNEGKQNYWREDNMDDRFIEALQELATAVLQRKITYMFNKNYNLLEKLNEDEAFNIHNRLTYFIKNVRGDRARLWGIFRETPSFVF